MKISKVITKSKFGAPSTRKRPNQISLTATTHTTLGAITSSIATTGVQQEDLAGQPKRRLIIPHQILPSISTLKKQQFGVATTLTTASSYSSGMNQTTLLPDDQFTRLYGRPFPDGNSMTYQNSVVTLTPPSSPDSEKSVEDNVGSLVDEHFRHSMQRFASAGKKNQTESVNGVNTNNLIANASIIEQDFAGVVNRLLNGDVSRYMSAFDLV